MEAKRPGPPVGKKAFQSVFDRVKSDLVPGNVGTLRVTPVTPTAGALLNQVLGVSFATTDKAVPHVNVAGFVAVRAVNTKERTLTLLAPCGGALPSRFLVLGGQLSWTETS